MYCYFIFLFTVRKSHVLYDQGYVAFASIHRSLCEVAFFNSWIVVRVGVPFLEQSLQRKQRIPTLIIKLSHDFRQNSVQKTTKRALQKKWTLLLSLDNQSSRKEREERLGMNGDG